MCTKINAFQRWKPWAKSCQLVWNKRWNQIGLKTITQTRVRILPRLWNCNRSGSKHIKAAWHVRRHSNRFPRRSRRRSRLTESRVRLDWSFSKVLRTRRVIMTTDRCKKRWRPLMALCQKRLISLSSYVKWSKSFVARRRANQEWCKRRTCCCWTLRVQRIACFPLAVSTTGSKTSSIAQLRGALSVTLSIQRRRKRDTLSKSLRNRLWSRHRNSGWGTKIS